MNAVGVAGETAKKDSFRNESARRRGGSDGRLGHDLREGDAASERAGARPLRPPYRGDRPPPEE
jgi:hypothetical protein